MLSPGGLTTPVALKLVRSDLDIAPEALARLRDEARLLARLQHPNVVRVLDLCTLTGPDGAARIALVTELIDGRDLGELARGDPALLPRAATEVMAAVCNALAAAWDSTGPDGQPMRVVHRDIKPSNIAIGRRGEIRVLDFGIASFEGEDREARTATAMLVGSLPYLAPERFLERGTRGPADVFAVGAVWYELLTGQAWFAGISPRMLPGLAADRDRYEAWRWDRIQNVPQEMRDTLGPLLAWDPSSRPTAAELGRTLEDLASGMEGPTLRSWCRERVWDDPAPHPGALAGQVLTEGVVESRPPSQERRAIAAPTIVRAPLATVNSTGDPQFEERLRIVQVEMGLQPDTPPAVGVAAFGEPVVLVEAPPAKASARWKQFAFGCAVLLALAVLVCATAVVFLGIAALLVGSR